MTVPLVVIVALALGSSSDDGAKPSATPTTTSTVLGPISVPAPPHVAAYDAPCTKVLGALPITLDALPGRPARSTTSYVAAWGDPPIVLRCGVPRPASLVPGSTAQIFSANGADGVNWLPQKKKDATVWTTVDRAVYIEVTVPSTYATPPLNTLGSAIGKALPAVCSVDPSEPDVSKLCTRRR